MKYGVSFRISLISGDAFELSSPVRASRHFVTGDGPSCPSSSLDTRPSARLQPRVSPGDRERGWSHAIDGITKPELGNED
jgi:hypothetical protein